LSRLRSIFEHKAAFDPESEREALQRQRAEATAELAALKRSLAERVANIQLRERELAEAIERVEQREAALAGSDGKGVRVHAIRARLAEAKAARAARGDEKERVALESRRSELDGRAAELAALEEVLAAREAALARAPEHQDDPGGQLAEAEAPRSPDATKAALEQELVARAKELETRESALAEREQVATARTAELDAYAEELEARALPADPKRAVPAAANTTISDELARLEEKLEEVRAAEGAFARTHAELATRSDALAEREASLAARERAATAKEAPAGEELAILEARIRRLEQGGRGRGASTQTFSDGLRSLERRGLKTAGPDEHLH